MRADEHALPLTASALGWQALQNLLLYFVPLLGRQRFRLDGMKWPLHTIPLNQIDRRPSCNESARLTRKIGLCKFLTFEILQGCLAEVCAWSIKKTSCLFLEVRKMCASWEKSVPMSSFPRWQLLKPCNTSACLIEHLSQQRLHKSALACIHSCKAILLISCLLNVRILLST